MVDWDRIRELRDEIGEDDCAEVVELFFCEVDSAIRRLEQPATAAQRQADLHYLKGSAVNLGFRAFGGLCSDAEQQAADGTLTQSEVDDIIECYHASRRVFEAGCAAAA